tara:strand:+ start:392 stop:568 length:177 start_codon:yes stop_codon:yes gene_type:complete
MRVVERASARDMYEIEKIRQRMLDKFDLNEYDVVVTYNGVFDILEYLQTRGSTQYVVN